MDGHCIGVVKGATRACLFAYRWPEARVITPTPPVNDRFETSFFDGEFEDGFETAVFRAAGTKWRMIAVNEDMVVISSMADSDDPKVRIHYDQGVMMQATTTLWGPLLYVPSPTRFPPAQAHEDHLLADSVITRSADGHYIHTRQIIMGSMVQLESVRSRRVSGENIYLENPEDAPPVDMDVVCRTAHWPVPSVMCMDEATCYEMYTRCL